MPYEYRAYWDRVGHKRNCPTWGDEEMIYSCTCGVPPQTATGRLIYDVGRRMLQGGGGGSYHNPSNVTVGFGGSAAASGGVGGSYSVQIPSVAEVLGPERTAALRRYSESLDVDYPGVEKNPYEVGSVLWMQQEQRRKIQRQERHILAVDLSRTESTVVYGYERRNMNRRETIKARMRQLEEELAKIDRFPKDTFENGTILRFNKLFDISWEQYDRCEQAERDSITVYTYAAIKANGYWYCSGHPNRAPQRVHWDALIEWMGDGVRELWLMGMAEELITGSKLQAAETKVEITGGGGPGTAEVPTEPAADEDLSRSYQELGD